ARMCGDVRCKVGRRCATRYDGEKTCVCRETCKSNQHLICGSDGKTYTNYCHLHRSSCLEDKHVTVLHQGPCLIERKSAGVTRPLVCYQIQRDELRQLLVDWLKTEVTKVCGLTLSDKSYSDIVHETFSKCDVDKDGSLDGDELLKCTEKKPAHTNLTLCQSQQGMSKYFRGLCMDALINMGDGDDNWVLNEEEFIKILSLHFTPPTRECQLEDKNYKDGAETKLDCNLCVCACGNWVCTGAPCYRGKEMGVPGNPHFPVIQSTNEKCSMFFIAYFIQI
ncbi:hypothetical protein LOTGIDRAFT_112867, partial [Lottia gigantea]